MGDRAPGFALPASDTRGLRHREGFYGISKRAVFVVDRGGTIRYAWITDDSLEKPDIEAVLQAVANLAWFDRSTERESGFAPTGAHR